MLKIELFFKKTRNKLKQDSKLIKTRLKTNLNKTQNKLNQDSKAN